VVAALAVVPFTAVEELILIEAAGGCRIPGLPVVAADDGLATPPQAGESAAPYVSANDIRHDEVSAGQEQEMGVMSARVVQNGEGRPRPAVIPGQGRGQPHQAVVIGDIEIGRRHVRAQRTGQGPNIARQQFLRNQSMFSILVSFF